MFSCGIDFVHLTTPFKKFVLSASWEGGRKLFPVDAADVRPADSARTASSTYCLVVN